MDKKLGWRETTVGELIDKLSSIPRDSIVKLVDEDYDQLMTVEDWIVVRHPYCDLCSKQVFVYIVCPDMDEEKQAQLQDLVGDDDTSI